MLVTKSKNLNYSLVEKKTDEEQGEAFTKSEAKEENTEAKTCIKVQRSTQALNKTKSFMDLVLFKQVSKHGKFHYSFFMEEAVTTIIFQTKRNPR